jgi:putative ribosome biogenesis GTPase RsgA
MVAKFNNCFCIKDEPKCAVKEALEKEIAYVTMLS